MAGVVKLTENNKGSITALCGQFARIYNNGHTCIIWFKKIIIILSEDEYFQHSVIYATQIMKRV